MVLFYLPTILHYLTVTFAVSILYAIALGVYRVYFGPLRHIPGPKLAAATRWVELYYDAIKYGKYFQRIDGMHEEFGPIIRINPFEVHIRDPDYFNELYNMKLKLHKDPWYYLWLDRDGSIFATIDPDLHRLRSGPIKKGLSTASVARVEHVLKEHFSRLNHRIEESRDQHEPINISNAFRGLNIDVVTDISLPKSMALLDTPDMGLAFHQFVRKFGAMSMWNRQFPILIPFLNSLPRWLVGLQGETALNIYDLMQAQRNQAQDVINNQGKSISDKSFPVIMNEVYKSEDIPMSEKTPRRLFDEISIVIGAGSETTSTTLEHLTYHILTNPKILQRLKAELSENFTSESIQEVLSYKQLETLPYLTAVITEGLRIAIGVSGRLPRINKYQPMTYTAPSGKTYTIPPGSVISMSIREMHHNPECFPSPHIFDPERWLGDNKAANMKYFAPFGRGPRSCVGLVLAWAELYMAIGNLFARFEVELAEGVTEADVKMEHECFSPFAAEGRKGVFLDVVR